MSIFNKSIEIAMADFSDNYPLRCQVWSFAYFGSKLIGIGRNTHKTHPLNLKNRLEFHGGGFHINKGTCSELNLAIKIKNRTNFEFNRLTIVNVRLNKQKQTCMSAPCSSCQSLFRFLKPNRVFFTNNVGQFEEYNI